MVLSDKVPIRCFFCIPLRLEVSAFGYIKLVLIPIVYIFGCIIILLISSDMYMRGNDIGCWIVFGVFDIVSAIGIVDMGYTVLFLISIHRKKIRIRKLDMYYILNIIEVVVMTVHTVLMTTVCVIYSTLVYNIPLTIAVFIVLGLQIYFTVLLRSQIKILENNQSNVNFNSLANEAEQGRVKLGAEQRFISVDSTSPLVEVL